jgi:hypothetical protein
MSSNEQHFDEVVVMRGNQTGTARALVVHRNVAGELFAYHSPLEVWPITCAICEQPGTRVYVRDER